MSDLGCLYRFYKDSEHDDNKHIVYDLEGGQDVLTYYFESPAKADCYFEE